MKGNHPQSDSRLSQATGRAFDLANDCVVKLWDVALGPLTKKNEEQWEEWLGLVLSCSGRFQSLNTCVKK